MEFAAYARSAFNSLKKLCAKGDSIICRNTGKKILRMLLTIRDFEAHLKVVLNDYDRNTFTEALDKLSKWRASHPNDHL